MREPVGRRVAKLLGALGQVFGREPAGDQLAVVVKADPPVAFGDSPARLADSWYSPGHLAVVTETGTAASVTHSIGHIWAMLAGLYGRSLVLLEHYPVAQDAGSEEHLDLVRVGPGGGPCWTRVWPTAEDAPRHHELDAWMAAYGHQIVSE